MPEKSFFIFYLTVGQAHGQGTIWQYHMSCLLCIVVGVFVKWKDGRNQETSELAECVLPNTS